MTGAERIAKERQRQIDEEGYSAVHDYGHAEELAQAASCYALTPGHRQTGRPGHEHEPFDWPWDPVYWKPTPEDRVRELEKAGALIAAAIDDLLRR